MLLDRSGVKIDRISFLRGGRLTPGSQTTLTGPSSVDFLEEDGAKQLILKTNDVLETGELRDARIVSAVLNKDDMLSVRVVGTTRSLVAGPIPGVDRRPTLFELVSHQPAVMALFAIIVWIFPTVISIRKFLQESLVDQHQPASGTPPSPAGGGNP
jgi:hypothetical protein